MMHGPALPVLALAAAVAVATSAPAHTVEELEAELLEREPYVQMVDQPAPNFALADADGRPVSLESLRGSIVVLNFIFTRCPDVCPLHSEAIAEVQRMVNRTPMVDQVRFVTITTDPARDTPEVLRAYGPLHGLDPVNWSFLTSGVDAPDATRELAQAYGLEFTPTPDGYQMHGVVTHLIDRNGRMRARYHGLRFGPTNLVVHINALVNDVPHPHEEPSLLERLFSLF